MQKIRKFCRTVFEIDSKFPTLIILPSFERGPLPPPQNWSLFEKNSRPSRQILYPPTTLENFWQVRRYCGWEGREGDPHERSHYGTRLGIAPASFRSATLRFATLRSVTLRYACSASLRNAPLHYTPLASLPTLRYTTLRLREAVSAVVLVLSGYYFSKKKQLSKEWALKIIQESFLFWGISSHRTVTRNAHVSKDPSKVYILPYNW